MRSSRGAIGTLTRAALALAMLAVAVRVLIPAGYMPGGAGQAAIVLCTSQGLQTAYLPQDAEKRSPVDDHSGKSQTHHPCAFASAAHVFTPQAEAAHVPVLWRAQTSEPAWDPSVAPGRGLAAPPPPSTGPPLQI